MGGGEKGCAFVDDLHTPINADPQLLRLAIALNSFELGVGANGKCELQSIPGLRAERSRLAALQQFG